jgi:hypothetical protein
MSSGITGHLLEAEVFGDVIVAWSGTMEYVPYRQAMRRCREHQPKSWDPTDPSTRAGSDLYASVALMLEAFVGQFDWGELKLFSSIGSPLDFFHGVDGWFEFRGRIVTVDITANRYKEGGYKADAILLLEDGDDKIVFRGIERIPQLLLGAA